MTNGSGPTAKIESLLKRAGGCTQADVLKAVGWKAVSMQLMAARLGLKLNINKSQKPCRYSVSICEQAKSATPERPVFTNCGNAGDQETPEKSAKRLTRVPFKVSRLMEFCTYRELVNQTGHDVEEWPLVVLKELVDNALDAAEEAEIAPVVSIAVKGDSIIVEDNGPGIPADTIDGVLDYGIRVSSREAYCSPTRGAQGNALKTILPMAYVLNESLGESACGESIIEAHGAAHHIRFSVDHIKQEPKIQRTTKPSHVVKGTRIKV